MLPKAYNQKASICSMTRHVSAARQINKNATSLMQNKKLHTNGKNICDGANTTYMPIH